MWALIQKLFTSLSKGWLKDVLSGAGIMLASNYVIISAFEASVNALRNKFNGVPSDILSLLSLTGFDVAISIILSAIVTRLTLQSQKLFFKKASR